MKRKVIISISAVIFLAVVSLFSFRLFYKVSSQMDYGVEGWKLYDNRLAKFSITYPTLLNIKEDNSVSPYGSKRGWVCFYEGNYKEADNGHCKEGFAIYYELPYIDGKGGGCDKAHLSQVKILGKMERACITDKTLSGPIYLAHPKGYVDVEPRVEFSSLLTVEVAKKMLKSFRFTDIN